MIKIDISSDAILHLIGQLDREETTQFLADTLRALLMDRECLRGERDAARMMVDDMGLDLRQEVAILEIKLDWSRDERDQLLTALLAWLYADDTGDEEKRADAIAQARRVVQKH
jgi:hypothetical protein